MTGSRAQWYNGIALLITFFSCRIIWGTWQSVLVFRDMFAALKQTWDAQAAAAGGPVNVNPQVFGDRLANVVCSDELCVKANAEVSQFAKYTAGGVPTWLVATYVSSNLILNFLNYYWFSKMIDAVMKRFREPAPTEAPQPGEEGGKEVSKTIVEASGDLQKGEENFLTGDASVDGNSSTGADIGNSVKELRNRTATASS